MTTNLFSLDGKIAKLVAEQGAHMIVSSRKFDDCQMVGSSFKECP